MDKESPKTNYLMNQRKGNSKAFAYSDFELDTRSVQEDYMKDPMYKQMNQAHKDCIMWAASYTETMLTRVKAEDPEYFAVKGMNKAEM